MKEPTFRNCEGVRGALTGFAMPTENFKNEAGQTSDTRIMARAIEQRWPISPEHRAAIIEILMGIAKDPKASKREKASAARAIMAADRINLDEAPPPQEINLNVSGDMAAAIKSVAAMSDEKRAKLAEADRIIEENEAAQRAADEDADSTTD